MTAPDVSAHPKNLGAVLPTHVAQRLRRLIFTSQATIDRDGHGCLAITCEPPHVTWTGLDDVEVTVYDTGDPDAGTRRFRVTVEAIDEDLATPDTDEAAQPAPPDRPPPVSQAARRAG